MNLEQAKLLAAGYRHVLGVDELDYSISPFSYMSRKRRGEEAAPCFFASLMLAGIIPEGYERSDPYCHLPQENGALLFGVSVGEIDRVIKGGGCGDSCFQTGERCAAKIKSLIEKYGYQLDANGYIVERNFARECLDNALNGSRLLTHEVEELRERCDRVVRTIEWRA